MQRLPSIPTIAMGAEQIPEYPKADLQRFLKLKFNLQRFVNLRSDLT